MNNTIKVLKFFADNKDKSYSIRQVAGLLNMSYKLVYKEILTLDKGGSIMIRFAGRAKMCGFNYNYNSLIVEVEEERKKELFRNRDLQLIYNRIIGLKQPFFILLVFGSYANKTFKKASDIDLCLISDNKITNRLINEILEITPVKVHLNEFTTKEFLDMLLTNKENVAHEIVKNNIILYGVESFYEMIKNVQ